MKIRRTLTAWCAGIFVFYVTLLSVPFNAEAGSKETIGDIKVSYSNAGFDAYYDSSDGTLTVEVWQSGASLSIKIGTSASGYWGSYCDIYILAPNVDISTIKIKGNSSTFAFVCGQVRCTSNFSLKDGIVGATDYYGSSFGLETTSAYCALPSKISIKNGKVYGALLTPYVSTITASSEAKVEKETILKAIKANAEKATEDEVEE